MIEIKLHNVSKNDRPLLLALSAMFQSVANGAYGQLADTTTIAPEDNPSAGAAADEVFADGARATVTDANGNVPTAAMAFADPAQVFGGKSPAGAVDGNPAISAPGSASTPAAPLSAAPGSAVAVELDADGFPWDGRIHSSSKDKVKDGTWRARRNVDAAVVAAVQTELRQVMNLPNPLTQFKTAAELGMVPPPPSAPAAVPVPNVPLPPMSSAASPDAPASGTPASVPSAAVDGTLTFAKLIPMITSRIGKTLTQEQVQDALSSLGLPSLPSLVQRPDLVPSMAMLLGIQ